MSPSGVCGVSDHRHAHVNHLQKTQVVRLFVVAEVEGAKGLFAGHEVQDVDMVIVMTVQRVKKVEEATSANLRSKNVFH